LLVASLTVIVLTWFVLDSISNGLSAKLMAFEREPSQGWGYWYWFFIKRNMWGILGTLAILLLLACLVVWGWVAFVRDVRRKRVLHS